MCAFTRQYTTLQKLYGSYRDAGFGMVAVPSDDFNQELSSDAEIKDFCELNYDIDILISEKLSVKGIKGTHSLRRLKPRLASFHLGISTKF